MKRALIFLHGNKPNVANIKKTVKKSDTIICADGGAEYALEAGLVPEIVLGDFDSLPLKYQKKLIELGTSLQEFPTEKDFTDSELAVNYALAHGYRDLVLFGVVGTRIDHFLANITYLSKKSQDGIKVIIIDNAQIIYLVSYELDLLGKKGDTVSLIPIEKDADGVTTRGLKWELYNERLLFGATRGVSNEFIKSKAHISIKKGTLLVIHSKNAS